MIGEIAYAVWAPPGGLWSPWAKPVLFASMAAPPPAVASKEPEWTNLSWAPDLGAGTAIVADVEGDAAVRIGLALARRGYRPVPLFNGAPAPAGAGAIDLRPVEQAVLQGVPLLKILPIAPQAPPVFLLDERRLFTPAPGPGVFDNRWMAFPQDFPSALFLRSAGIARVLLARSSSRPVGEDLAHVLLRWKEGGLVLEVVDPRAAEPPRPLEVSRPSGFRSMMRRAMVLLGLRRNSAGGFGSLVPTPQEPGRGGWG